MVKCFERALFVLGTDLGMETFLYTPIALTYIEDCRLDRYCIKICYNVKVRFVFRVGVGAVMLNLGVLNVCVSNDLSHSICFNLYF
jgi:hypothetical protein